jgi:hypothetical protein
MALNDRQVIFYQDTCDIYNPSPITGNRFKNGEIQDLNYPSTATYSDQKYLHETAPEIEKGKFYGRTNKEDTVSILDRAHFDVALDIRSNAVIRHKTTDDPNEGEWFICVGEGMVKNYVGNKQVFYVKAITKPLGIT